MGIFSRLSKLFQGNQPVTLDDPSFGKLRFQDVGFWEGNVEFSPLQQTVEVLVDAGESGPTEEQRQWFKEIESKYTSFFPIVVEAVWLEVHR